MNELNDLLNEWDEPPASLPRRPGRPPKNLVGKRFGRLIVIAFVNSPDSIRNNRRWLCECDCGGKFIANAARLLRSRRPVRSCGCLQKENRILIGTRRPQRNEPFLWRNKFDKLMSKASDEDIEWARSRLNGIPVSISADEL